MGIRGAEIRNVRSALCWVGRIWWDSLYARGMTCRGACRCVLAFFLHCRAVVWLSCFTSIAGFTPMLGGLSLFSIFTLVIVISGIHTGIPLHANVFFFCKIVFLGICQVQLCVIARFEWRVGKDVKQSPFRMGASLTMIRYRLLVLDKGERKWECLNSS
jgi:hypothetical protein